VDVQNDTRYLGYHGRLFVCLQRSRAGVNSRHILVDDGRGFDRYGRVLFAGLAVGDVIAVCLIHTPLHRQYSPQGKDYRQSVYQTR
jgi:hypothetical protein